VLYTTDYQIAVTSNNIIKLDLDGPPDEVRLTKQVECLFKAIRGLLLEQMELCKAIYNKEITPTKKKQKISEHILNQIL